MFNKLASEASLLNKNYCFAPALRVTKFITISVMNLVTFCSVVLKCLTNWHLKPFHFLRD